MKLNRMLVSSLVALVLTLGIVAFPQALPASNALAQGKQDFILHNKTGVEIHELYVCPHSSNDWGDDILGQDTLPIGESLEITFSRKDKARMWDLRIVDGSGNAIEWENLDLLKIAEVTLNKKGNKVWADTK